MTAEALAERERSASALAPVRAALVGRARERAGQMVSRAEEEAAGRIASAQRAAARVLDEARAAGKGDGQAAAVAERSRARARAREVVLAARMAAYEELHRRVRAATRELCTGPDRAAFAARLKVLARQRLGTEAVIEEPSGGGVIARTADAEIDLSADALAERAVAALGAGVMGLWTPR